MCVQRSAIAVRENQGLCRHGKNLAHRAVASVAEAQKHSHPFHFLHHRAPEVRQTTILILATPPRSVGGVVGHEHPAYTQVVVELDEAELVAHSIGALNVETHCKASSGASTLDVTSLLQKKVLLRSGQKPMTQRSDHSQVLFGTLFPEANVHSDGVKACRLVPRKLGQEGWVVRSQW